MRYITFLIPALLLPLTNLHAQIINGIVTDKKKEPITNASVSIKQNGILKGGGITDIDGKYSVKLTDTGRYDVTVSYLGYQTTTITKIHTAQADTASLDFILQPENGRSRFICYTIHCYCPPLLDPYKTNYKITTAQMRGVNMMK